MVCIIRVSGTRCPCCVGQSPRYARRLASISAVAGAQAVAMSAVSASGSAGAIRPTLTDRRLATDMTTRPVTNKVAGARFRSRNTRQPHTA